MAFTKDELICNVGPQSENFDIFCFFALYYITKKLEVGLHLPPFRTSILISGVSRWPGVQSVIGGKWSCRQAACESLCASPPLPPSFPSHPLLKSQRVDGFGDSRRATFANNFASWQNFLHMSTFQKLVIMSWFWNFGDHLSKYFEPAIEFTQA